MTDITVSRSCMLSERKEFRGYVYWEYFAKRNKTCFIMVFVTGWLQCYLGTSSWVGSPRQVWFRVDYLDIIYII